MMRLTILLASALLLIACDRSSEVAKYPTKPGPECSTAAPCVEGNFCNYSSEAVCGESGAVGVCFPKPAKCTDANNPVCGCDGRSYGNLCVAHSYGVAVRHQGVCGQAAPTGDCGGTTGAECAAGQFCKYELADACGDQQQAGNCTDRPTVCTKERRPVCGCDGRNYANVCVAHSHGTSVRHEGLCGKAATTAPPSAVVPAKECMRGGCSGELCVEKGVQVASICQWRDEYACYRTAQCEVQSNGKCGWTQTSELTACLAKGGP